MLLAATPLTPPQDGKTWAFHLINDTAEPIDSGVVESVDYEWGDQGNGVSPDAPFGAIAPGSSLEIWREDGDAAELRTSLTIRVRVSGVDRKFTGDFGKLYRKSLAPVPLLKRDGVLGAVAEVPAPEPRLRAWHAGAEFLVDRGRTRTPIVRDLSQELPEGPWSEVAEFARLDAQGNVLEEYRVSSWSLDDELGFHVFAVVDGALRGRTVRTYYGSDDRTKVEEETVLGGLRDVSPGDRKTLDFLWNALEAERRRLEERAVRLRQEGEARVAAIPGPRKDPGLGERYGRARNVLQDRVKNYGNGLDQDLLTLLNRLGMLAESLTPSLPGTLVAAVGALATGCRRAAFDYTVDREKPAMKKAGAKTGEFLSLPPGLQAELRRLVDSLGKAHRDLMAAADVQSEADANQNAAEFHKAADLIARAKELLEEGLRPC